MILPEHVAETVVPESVHVTESEPSVTVTVSEPSVLVDDSYAILRFTIHFVWIGL